MTSTEENIVQEVRFQEAQSDPEVRPAIRKLQTFAEGQ